MIDLWAAEPKVRRILGGYGGEGLGGAVEHLLLVPVGDLPGALADLHVRGLRIVGADQSATLTYREADLRGPLVVVVGSEGQGIGPAIRRRLDLTVRIPMHGRIASLNAAVAGSVLLLEAAGRRGPSPAPAPTVEPGKGGSMDAVTPVESPASDGRAEPPAPEGAAAEPASIPAAERSDDGARAAGPVDPPDGDPRPDQDEELLP